MLRRLQYLGFIWFCVLPLSIYFPFTSSISSRLLSIIFTTNISWMALIWQVLSGTLAVKVMEIYGVIPFKYLGPSVKRLILYTQRIGMSIKVNTKSALYVGMTLLLILLKIAFLKPYHHNINRYTSFPRPVDLPNSHFNSGVFVH